MFDKIDRKTLRGAVIIAGGQHSRLLPQVVDADSPARPSLAPAHFPTPSALGPTTVPTEIGGPVLRAGPECRNKTQSPQEGITKGTEVRVRAHADRTPKLQRGRHQAFRGPKSGARYKPVEVLQSGHF